MVETKIWFQAISEIGLISVAGLGDPPISIFIIGLTNHVHMGKFNHFIGQFEKKSILDCMSS